MSFLRSIVLWWALLAAVAVPSWATFPGYNGRIAFQCDGGDVCIVNADGSGAVRIVTAGLPAWSPGGGRLAFERRGDVYVMNADGRALTRVLDGPPPDERDGITFLAWTPDGERLRVIRQGALMIVNVTTRKMTVLGEARDLAYAWSPDGRRLALSRLVTYFTPGCGGSRFRSPTCSGYGSELWVGDADGGNRSRIDGPTSAPRDQLDWSPDGQEILFSSGGEAGTVRADGTEPKGPLKALRASWSPEGDRIVYLAYDGSLRLADRNLNPLDGTVVDASLHPGIAAWQPLRRIASLRTRGTRARVWCAQRCDIQARLQRAGGGPVREIHTGLPNTGERKLVLRPGRLTVEVRDVAGNQATLRGRIGRPG